MAPVADLASVTCDIIKDILRNLAFLSVRKIKPVKLVVWQSSKCKNWKNW